MKPILFNSEMVQAIIKGRKTGTRRVATFIRHTNDDEYEFFKKIPCKAGEALYVRETFACEGSDEKDAGHPFEDEGYNSDYATGEDFQFYGYVYKADTPNAKYPSGYPNDFICAPTWKPSIHMPKEAARIFLKVISVKLERLQDITEEQAKREGAKSLDFTSQGMPLHISGFIELWNSTVNKNDISKYGWEANPYVFVIEFERCEKEGNKL